MIAEDDPESSVDKLINETFLLLDKVYLGVIEP